MTALPHALTDPVLAPVNRARLAGEDADLPSAATRLFSYGTLRPGESNYHRIATIGGTWQQATIDGRVDACDRPPHTGLPALRLGPPGRVDGQILDSANMPAFFRDTLDAFEGPDYVRLLVATDAGAGPPIIANAYAFRPFLPL